ncbi:YraN family protein [Roseateles chitinivorans]|uniref:YraN family protein n=1 Tax=Roseateles chitinivorans TaxID=2917965 RepID=UPI003D677BE6
MFKKFSRGSTGTTGAVAAVAAVDTQARGAHAEQRALDHLTRQGLRLVARNYRVARGPSARGGEVDLILRERDGTLVFVEVRARGHDAHGGAAASVTRHKQRRVIFAAQCFLRTQRVVPPCRFDVVAIDGDRIEWLRGAFDAASPWSRDGWTPD